MRLVVSISQQTLTVLNAQNEALAHYSISTAANGAGCEKNSGRTPLGKHIVRAKIGEGAPAGTVFIGRRPQFGQRQQLGLRPATGVDSIDRLQ